MKSERFYGTSVVHDLIPKLDYNLFDIDSEHDEFITLVFSPDPVTLNPQSDVAFMMSSADEGFKDFVREKLLRPNGSANAVLADSVEESEVLVKPNIMTANQYYNYVREYVTSLGDNVNKSDT